MKKERSFITEKAFKKVTNSIICSSIVAVILGLIMIFYPGLSIVTCGIIAGIFVIVYGILLIVLDFQASKFLIPFDGMLSGIACIILGFILCVRPGIVATIITITLGLWIVLSSINVVKIAISMRKTDAKWILLLIFGILDFICGIIVLCNPFASAISLTLFVGIMIVVHSIVTIIDTIILKNNVKEFANAQKEKVKSLK